MTTYTYFVSDVDGNNADSGADWANAKQTVAGALAAAAAVPVTTGDIVIINCDSASTTFVAAAAITWTPVAGVHYAVRSVNRAGGDALLTGYTESVGAASFAFTVTGADGASWDFDGLTFNGGTNNNTNCAVVFITANQNPTSITGRNCTVDSKSANANTQIKLGPSNTSTSGRNHKIVLENWTFIVSGSRTSDALQIGHASVRLINPSFSMTGASKPAALFGSQGAHNKGTLLVEDADLSGYNVSSGAYFNVAGMGGMQAVLLNCALSATPTLVTATWSNGDGSVLSVLSDGADTFNTFEYHNRFGSVTETASVYATNGAQFNGAGMGWQITTTAACNEWNPFILPPLIRWNASTGAETPVIELANNSGSGLLDSEIYVKWDYPSNTGLPRYTPVNNRDATPFVSAGSAHASSTNGWTGLGGTNTQQKMSPASSFTPVEVGLLRATIFVTKTSASNIFIDPVSKTSEDFGRTVWTLEGAFTEDAAGGGGAETFTGSQFNRGLN